jgi:hypothetical protein
VPFPVSRYFADRDSAVVYWLPSIRTWGRMMWTAGFDRVERTGRFKVHARDGWSVRHVGHRCSKGL